MDSVTVLITGAGAPGIKGTLYSLRNNFDGRKIRTVGVDIKEDVVGRYLCDSFYKIPKPSEDSFIPTLLDICQKEKAEVILPQVTDELFKLAEFKKEFERIGTKVAISSKRSIDIANNKYELMKVARGLNLPAPQSFLADNIDDIRKCVERLGWPERPVIVKPPISSGMRGLRVVYEKRNLRDAFYTEKAENIYIYVKFEELENILGSSFPELLVMQFLPGREYSADVLVANGVVVIPRSRDMVRTGITFNGTVENNERIIEYSEKASKTLGLEYAFGFQFRLDEDGIPNIIECNPRIQGTMVLSTLAGANIVYGAVKHALGERVPEFEIKWGVRLLRYWGGLVISSGEVVGEIL